MHPSTSQRPAVSSYILTTLLLVLSCVWAACDSTGSAPAPADRTPMTLSFVASGTSAGASAKAAKSQVYTDEAGNTVTIETAELVLREIEFERADAGEACRDDDSDDDCEEVEEGPVLVELPLDSDQPSVVIEAALPAGTWKAVEFDIHKLDDDDDDDAAFLQETGFPEDVSVRVTGTWTAAGGSAQSFVYTSDLNEEKDIEFEPPIDVSAEAPKNVTFRVDIDTWFRQSDGSLVDPAEGNDDGQYEDLIEANIETSIEGFEDDDRNGCGDDGDDSN